MFDLKIGFECNNNCIHCVVADKRYNGHLSMPQLIQIIDTIPEGDQVQITGGEPSIVKYLPDILKHCKCRNLITTMQSNGTGFADEDFLLQCKDYLDHVHIAIHSCYREEHDAIVQCKGMYDKTIQGLNNLVKHNISITTQTVLSNINYKSVYDTFCFIQSIKPETKMSITYPHMMGNAYHNRESIGFQYRDFKEELHKTLEAFAEYIFTEAIPLCYLHPYVNRIYGMSEKNILLNVPRSGVDFSDGLHEKNYNLADIKDKRKLSKCKECIYNHRCIGVWKEYIELYKSSIDLYPIVKE